MKAGTTTLYRDLMTHPRVYFPLDKEPNNLCDDAVLTDHGRAAYAAHFRRARPDQLCAEASTAYTKIPVYTGAAERARRLLGPGLRAIYLVRDPVARIVSQHHHELTVGRLEVIPDINEAVRRTPRYLDYSRYAMQVRPWIEAFGAMNVRIVPFEQYVRDRRGRVAELERFLGLDPRPDLVEAERVFNAADSKPGRTGRLAWLTHSGVYRTLVRPFVGQELRDRVRRALHGRPPPVPRRRLPRRSSSSLTPCAMRCGRFLRWPARTAGCCGTSRRFAQSTRPGLVCPGRAMIVERKREGEGQGRSVLSPFRSRAFRKASATSSESKPGLLMRTFPPLSDPMLGVSGAWLLPPPEERL